MKHVKINGVEIYIEEAESYIQINDIQGHDLAAIWDILIAKYPGYEIVLCFHDMPVPTDILEKIGAELLEDCLELQVRPQDIQPHGGFDIVPLQKSDFGGFAKLHDTVNPAPDMYWTSSRIWPKWDNWRIFVCKSNGEIIGYSMIMVALRDESIGEMFAVHADNPALRKALLSAAVASAFECGKSVVLNMVERNDTGAQEDSFAVGFREVGYYQGYCVRQVGTKKGAVSLCIFDK